jgi:trehalose 6-phosphate synthase
LEGLVAANLLGFHTYDYARHFLSSCSQLLGAHVTPKGVEIGSHVASIGVFPIGIDP